MNLGTLKHNWTLQEVLPLFEMPFNDLIYQAQTIHRQNFDPNAVQISTLLNIKTGGCPETCAYCPQSAHYDTGVKREKLMSVDEVVEAAKKAKSNGASRFCMGAAWRSPKDRDLDSVIDMIIAIKGEGLETCVTLGMLTEAQAQRLKEAGLDYYNHNIDTSPEYYEKIISSRDFDDRINTLENVRKADINVCCGGIMGMGETREDRAGFLMALANLPAHPQSVPINKLIKIGGTPLENQEDLDVFEFIRVVAIARIMMPRSMVRLSAGRTEMSAEMQSLCFLAGANSIHYGEKLLITANPDMSQDQTLFAKLGIKPFEPSSCLMNA